MIYLVQQPNKTKKGDTIMWETVKEVNGHKIFRMAGTRGCYHIRLDEHKEVTFRTIKAAAEWANNH